MRTVKVLSIALAFAMTFTRVSTGAVRADQKLAGDLVRALGLKLV